MASIWAARSGVRRVVACDSAAKLGAKILVAGGGRCNVTHEAVSEAAYSGSTPPAIRKVLRRFDVPQTREFFAAMGVELKAEDTGKLFPVTDDAHTVLNALMGEVRRVGVRLVHPARVAAITRIASGFEVAFESAPPLHAGKVILSTGGRSLPKSGSDGHGYAIAQSLGHSVTSRMYPALVPLTLPSNHAITSLSGLAVPMTLEVRSTAGKKLATFTNSTLCTHFGLSGPGPLDISRHLQHAQASDHGASLVMNVLPGHTPEELDSAFQKGGNLSVLTLVRRVKKSQITKPPENCAEGVELLGDLPERLIAALCTLSGIDPSTLCHSLTRDQRKAIVTSLTALVLPITGTRGYTYAEVTAGGVPLSELHLDTMQSRVCPGLHMCGEILDVDGQIGGYNFQWAWASGYLAGSAAAL